MEKFIISTFDSYAFIASVISGFSIETFLKLTPRQVFYLSASCSKIKHNNTMQDAIFAGAKKEDLKEFKHPLDEARGKKDSDSLYEEFKARNLTIVKDGR